MIRKIFVDLLLIVSIVALLYTRYIDISIYNARPDLILIFVVFIGLFEGKYHPIIFGFFSGLSIDFISGTVPLGFNALIYTIIGYLTILPHKFFKIEAAVISPFVIFLFYTVKTVMYMTLGYIFLNENIISAFISNILLGEFVYTLLISIPIFYVLKKIYSFMDKIKRYV